MVAIFPLHGMQGTQRACSQSHPHDPFLIGAPLHEMQGGTDQSIVRNPRLRTIPCKEMQGARIKRGKQEGEESREIKEIKIISGAAIDETLNAAPYARGRDRRNIGRRD